MIRLLKEFGQIYGVGPKLASMALASLLIAAGRSKPGWVELGRSFVVVDSLVHNFLHRTGILAAYGHSHAYGQACYGKAGCSVVLYKLAEAINLKSIEPRAPAYNPRLLQYVIWQFCAQTGLDICNGNHIDDRQACQRTDCPIGRRCPRLPLKPLGKAQRPSKTPRPPLQRSSSAAASVSGVRRSARLRPFSKGPSTVSAASMR